MCDQAWQETLTSPKNLSERNLSEGLYHRQLEQSALMETALVLYLRTWPNRHTKSTAGQARGSKRKRWSNPSSYCQRKGRRQKYVIADSGRQKGSRLRCPQFTFKHGQKSGHIEARSEDEADHQAPSIRRQLSPWSRIQRADNSPSGKDDQPHFFKYKRGQCFSIFHQKNQCTAGNTCPFVHLREDDRPSIPNRQRKEDNNRRLERDRYTDDSGWKLCA